MKAIYSILVMALLVLSIMPMVLATDTGGGVGVNINTEEFKPLIWMCDSRSVTDDNYQNSHNGAPDLSERKHNYAFEGEQIHWKVLVMDKNKIEEIQDVVGTIGETQGTGNDIEVECKEDLITTQILNSCNARIGEEKLSLFDNKVMRYYDCTLTVEASMYGERFITVEAISADGSAIMAENEYWFLNPSIKLSVSDLALEFGEVRPGTDSYSQTLLVGNDADEGSGVILDMFISGDDFYDPDSSGAACPTTNQLALTQFRYFVTNGAFSSGDPGIFDTDIEGYTSIPNSKEISGAERIMRWRDGVRGAAPSSDVVEEDWTNGNTLSPGSEMALTFKLKMPEPCVGDFSEGQIYFWGEAI